MSHLTKQKSDIKFTDINLLTAAFKRLGGTLKQDQKTARFYAGQTASCDAAVTFEDSDFEIAINKNKDGEFELQADLYCGKLRRRLCHDMTSHYSKAQTEKVSEFYKIEELNEVALAGGLVPLDPIWDQKQEQWVLEYEKL